MSSRPGLHSSWRSYDSYNQLSRKLQRYLCLYIFLKGYFTQKWKICHNLLTLTLFQKPAWQTDCVEHQNNTGPQWLSLYGQKITTLISFLDELSLQCLVVYVCFCAYLVLCLSSDVSCTFTPVLCTHFWLCNAWKQPQTSLSIWPTYAETHTLSSLLPSVGKPQSQGQSNALI